MLQKGSFHFVAENLHEGIKENVVSHKQCTLNPDAPSFQMNADETYNGDTQDLIYKKHYKEPLVDINDHPQNMYTDTIRKDHPQNMLADTIRKKHLQGTKNDKDT